MVQWRSERCGAFCGCPIIIIELDLTEYFIKDIGKIIGILFSMVNPENEPLLL
jgi:hypothetical protein